MYVVRKSGYHTRILALELLLCARQLIQDPF